MLLLIFGFHEHVRGGHSIFPDFFSGQLPTRNLQSLQVRAEQVGRNAGIHERAKRHVAADA